MTHRCHVKGCPYSTRTLPWYSRHYVCPIHRLELDDDALFRPFRPLAHHHR